MRCISAAYAVMRCLSVCPSVCVCVCHVRELRQNEQRYLRHFFSPSGSQAILVFTCQTGWRYSDGNSPITGASNAGGVGKNTILGEYLASLHTGLQCYQPYESRSVNNKAATNGGKRRAEHSPRRPLFAQDDDEVFVTGSTLYAGDEGQPPRTQPPWS